LPRQSVKRNSDIEEATALENAKAPNEQNFTEKFESFFQKFA
jgi:hypothetical protein